MNFELADKLDILLETKQLDEAIVLAENELQIIPNTPFHKVLGRNLLHLAEDLKDYITAFEESTSKVLKKKRGFISSIFTPKERNKPVAFYGEMNGFTINYDRWYLELFSFEKYNLADWEWLSDFYDMSANDLTITGYEDLQLIFEDVHLNDRFDDPNILKAYQVCELIIILRLQELFNEVYKTQTGEWRKIPMFVSAHDYDLIYNPN